MAGVSAEVHTMDDCYPRPAAGELSCGASLHLCFFYSQCTLFLLSILSGRHGQHAHGWVRIDELRRRALRTS